MLRCCVPSDVITGIGGAGFEGLVMMPFGRMLCRLGGAGKIEGEEEEEARRASALAKRP